MQVRQSIPSCHAGAAYLVPPTAAPVGAAGVRSAMAGPRSLKADAGFAAEAADLPWDEDVRTACAQRRTAFGTALESFVRSGERIAVFGDYDVDGMCSTASMVMALSDARAWLARDVAAYGSPADRAAAHGISYVIPDRRDGYGLSLRAVEVIAASGVRCVVACDNGTNAIRPLMRAAELGIDVLVADHHPPSPETGSAAFWAGAAGRSLACNPMLAGDLRDLLVGIGHGLEMCAATVVDLVIAELHARLGLGKGHPHGAVLAGIATVTDVMPVRGINRRLAAVALSALATGRGLPGLSEIAARHLVKSKAIETAAQLSERLDGALDAEFVGFQLGPRLNACGRTGNASVGAEVLLSSADEAVALVYEVEALNEERKGRERQALAAVAELVDAGKPLADALWECVAGAPPGERLRVFGTSDGTGFMAIVPGVVAIACSPAADSGVAGLVAGKLASALGCAVLYCGMSARADGSTRLSGSGRVPRGSPLLAVSVGDAASKVFDAIGGRAGGHSAAFGASVDCAAGRTALLAAMRRAAVGIATLSCESLARLGTEELASVRGEGMGDAGTAAGICDLSVAASEMTPELAGAIAEIGPFGRGFEAPLLHVDLPFAWVERRGTGGTFSLSSTMPRNGKVIAFSSSFPGGADRIFEDGTAERLASGGCGIIGSLKRSFYGCGKEGARWRGPSAELVVEAIVEREGQQARLPGSA